MLAGGLASFAAPALAADPLQTPLPAPVPMREGVVDFGNVKLRYWDTGGTGEAVVFLHPGSGSAEFYPYQQPVFAQAGYRAISYSRRGQHGSEMGSDVDTFFASDDLRALLKHLGVGRFHAVGNALGGYLGLEMALSDADRVRSLVLAGSMMGITEPDYVKTLESLRPKAFDALPLTLKELGPSYRAANPQGVAEWELRQKRSGTRAPFRLRNKFTWDTIAGLKVPTLLMTGDADLWIPPWLLNQIAPRFPGAKIAIVPDAGHSLQWEQPALFNELVLAFIQGKP